MISKNQVKYIRQLEQKKFRNRERIFVAEGIKVVGDLLRRYQPRALFATADYLASLPLYSLPEDSVFEVTNEELHRISFQQHPQQVLAIFPIPEGSGIEELRSSEVQPLCLALDGIQDPGNLGTIIRIADWFGIDTIYCSPNTVDAWNPKVVQATMGSIARVNIIYINLPQLIDSLPKDTPIYGTFLDGDDIYAQALTSGGLIIMGNEGNGISPTVAAKVNCRLLIPDFHQGETADSLNVAIATAITCSEFRRRFSK